MDVPDLAAAGADAPATPKGITAHKTLPAQDAPDELTAGEKAVVSARKRTNRLLTGILILMSGGALYLASAFFMPVVLGILMSLTLSPLVRFLGKRGLSEGVASVLVVLVVTLGIGGTFAALGTPFYTLVDQVPAMTREVRGKFEQFRQPLSTVNAVAAQVDNATGNGGSVQRVSVEQPGIISAVAGSALSVVTNFAIVVVLTTFLLASGTHFSEQIVKSFNTFGDKKQALRTVRDIESKISRYLLTITVINAGLGLAVGLAMWALGMPTPLLWGMLAAILNFLPYVGSLIGIGIVAVVSIVTFPTIGVALLPPLAYFACTAVEGQWVTPTVVGRRLRINTVAVFIALAFWSFLWSIPGALMAVPILVFLKVLCDNVPGLNGLGRFLSAEEDEDEEEPDPAKLSVGP